MSQVATWSKLLRRPPRLGSASGWSRAGPRPHSAPVTRNACRDQISRGRASRSLITDRARQCGSTSCLKSHVGCSSRPLSVSSSGNKSSRRPSSAGSRSTAIGSTEASRVTSAQPSRAVSTEASRANSVEASKATSVATSRAPSTAASRKTSRAPTPTISAVSSPRRWHEHTKLDFEPSKLQIILDCILPVQGSSWAAPAQPVVPPDAPPPDDEERRIHSIPALPVALMLPSPHGDLSNFNLVVPSVPTTLVETPPKKASQMDIKRLDVSSPERTPCGRHARRGFAKRVLGLGQSPAVRETLKRLGRCSSRDDFSGGRKDATSEIQMHDVHVHASNEFFKEEGDDEATQASATKIRGGLAGDTPEALLWELRCRLTSAGVRPQSAEALRRATNLVRRRPETTIKRAVEQIKKVRMRLRRRQSSRNTQPGGKSDAQDLIEICNAARAAHPAKQVLAHRPQNIEVSRSLRFTHAEWHTLCKSLDFEEAEADRLLCSLGGSKSSGVNICNMFWTLRSIVAPDVSLERFASRVLTRYESFQNAFSAHSQQHSSLMGWPEFCALTKALDVNGANALKLWQLIVLNGLPPLDFNLYESEERTETPEMDRMGLIHRNITVDVFVLHLQAWLPQTALDLLMDQLLERFGSLEQGLYALERQGLQRHSPLCSVRLGASMKAIGLKNCDAEVIIDSLKLLPRPETTATSLTLETFPTEVCDPVSCDEVPAITFEMLGQAMDSLLQNSRRARDDARVVIAGDTQSIWKQLDAIKLDLAELELASLAPPSSPPLNRATVEARNARHQGETMRRAIASTGANDNRRHPVPSTLAPLYDVAATMAAHTQTSSGYTCALSRTMHASNCLSSLG